MENTITSLYEKEGMKDLKLKEYNRQGVSIFCYCCGRKLLTKQKFAYFNRITGLQVFHTKLYCPLCFFGHQYTWFDEDGDEIIERVY